MALKTSRIHEFDGKIARNQVCLFKRHSARERNESRETYRNFNPPMKCQIYREVARIKVCLNVTQRPWEK